MKRVLVTGGLGFIGSHLTEALLNTGHEVHVVDDGRTSETALWMPAVIKDYAANFVWHCCALEDVTLIPQMDEIYHLASPVGPAGILPHAGHIAYDVINTTRIVCDLAERDDAKLVDVSTSEVYGGGQRGLCGEDMPRIIQAQTTVRLEYATGKLAAETMVINRVRQGRIRAVIIRPFNVAGARQRTGGGFVIPRFVEQALTGQPLTVFGDGKAIRAFTHVEDIVNGLRLAMQRGRPGEVYNLGNPANKTTIYQLAKKVCDVLECEQDIQFVDPQTIYGEHYAEASDKFPDATKARLQLNWNPARPLSDIIRDVANEYLRRMSYQHN